MNHKKVSAFSICLAVAWSSLAPFTPAFAATMEAKAPALIPVSGLTLHAGSVPSAAVLPASSITNLDASAPSALPSADAAVGAAVSAAAMSASAVAAASAKPNNDGISAGETKDGPSLMGRLTAALKSAVSGSVLFDAARQPSPSAVGAMGLRPLKPANVPQGVDLDEPPTVPPAPQTARRSIAVDSPIELKADPKSEASVEAALRQLIDGSNLGVKASELKTEHVRSIKGRGEQADTIYALFQQQKNGFSIDGSQLSVMIKIVGGKPMIYDMDSRLQLIVDADTGAKLNDTELKQKAEQKMNLPQSNGAEYVEIYRKVLFLGGKWRAAAVYAIDNVQDVNGILVAVDVATGESFAWDARHGVTALPPSRGAAVPNSAPAPALVGVVRMQSGAFVMRIGRVLTTTQLAQVEQLIAASGVAIRERMFRDDAVLLILNGDAKAVAAAADKVSGALTQVAAAPGQMPLKPGLAAAAGSVRATAENKDTRPEGQPQLVEQALPYLNITVGGKKIMTDVDGKFTSEAAGDFQASLNGKWAAINDQNRKPVKIVGAVEAGAENVLVAKSEADDLLTLNQLNMYIWITRIHDWWADRLQGEKRFDRQLPVNVNINQDCNAYYTPGRPSLNFFKESSRCSDTGRPGVGAHEYGHFVDDMLGGIVNGGMSEGWGDIGSMYLLGTPIIGDGFLKNQTPSYIRHGENNYQYKKWDEVHAQGQAWMGFAWKLRKALIAKLGEAEGAAMAEALIVPTILAKASDIPGQMAKVLLNAKDKDGGTLHEAEIRAAAKAHGISLPGKSLEPESMEPAAPKVSLDVKSTRASTTVTYLGDADAARAFQDEVIKAVELAHIDYRKLTYSTTIVKGGYAIELKGDNVAVAYALEQIQRLAGSPASLAGPKANVEVEAPEATAGTPFVGTIEVKDGAPDVTTLVKDIKGVHEWSTGWFWWKKTFKTYMVAAKGAEVERLKAAGFAPLERVVVRLRWNRISDINGWGVEVNGSNTRGWIDTREFTGADVHQAFELLRDFEKDPLAVLQRDQKGNEYVRAPSVSAFERGYVVDSSISFQTGKKETKDERVIFSDGARSGYYR